MSFASGAFYAFAAFFTFSYIYTRTCRRERHSRTSTQERRMGNKCETTRPGFSFRASSLRAPLSERARKPVVPSFSFGTFCESARKPTETAALLFFDLFLFAMIGRSQRNTRCSTASRPKWSVVEAAVLTGNKHIHVLSRASTDISSHASITIVGRVRGASAVDEEQHNDASHEAA